MEIRVNCNNLVSLNNFKSLKLIRLGVLSYNLHKATLTGAAPSGGLIGTNNSKKAQINSCYNTGAVSTTAGYAGGIVSAGVDGERCAEMAALYLASTEC